MLWTGGDYLRRYYESYPACNKNDLVQVAHYVIESRMDHADAQSRFENKDLASDPVHSKDNFAVFLPQDGRGKRFELEITRDQILKCRY